MSCDLSASHGYSFFDRLPLPRQPLRLGNLSSGHLFGECITTRGCIFVVSVRSRQVVPLMGLDIVRRHSLAASRGEWIKVIVEGTLFIGLYSHLTLNPSSILKFFYTFFVTGRGFFK